MTDRRLTAAELVARYGCPLRAAARHPELRVELMAFNAALEHTVVAGTAEAHGRVQRALEDVLRRRARHARRA